MKFGIVIPFYGPRSAAEIARTGEEAGWDGFFFAETVWGWDAWVTLTGAAMVTERIRLGTILSPLSRMRPWKLASETATLDHLSNGRVTLGVGLGAVDTGFAEFGEVIDRKQRAELMDEGLDILTGLWAGQPFSYEGKHYQIQSFDRIKPEPPVQQPRIPIWVSGAFGYPKSMERVLRYDGVFPLVRSDDGWRMPDQSELRDLRQLLDQGAVDGQHIDIVIEGQTPADNAAAGEQVGPLAEAGATWWIEEFWTEPDIEKVKARVAAGPPAIG